MTNRVNFVAWGNRVDRITLPAYAMRQDYETDLEAVVRACERASRLVCCAGPRNEGTALNRGEPKAHHYAFTLGRPARGGGYSPEAEIWVSIPVGPPAPTTAHLTCCECGVRPATGRLFCDECKTDFPALEDVEELGLENEIL